MHANPTSSARRTRPRMRLGIIFQSRIPDLLHAALASGAVELRAACRLDWELGTTGSEWDPGVPLVNRVADLCRIEGLELILNLTDDPAVDSALAAHCPDGLMVLERAGLALLDRMAQAEVELEKVSLVKEEMDTILRAAQEGIQLADKDGILRYVNPAFTTITGVPPEHRVGFSVFDVSPDGALAQVLRTGRTVTGLRNRAKGSNAEVISNATPIYVDGEIMGAVCVFQDVTNVLALTRHLQESSAIISHLSERLTQLQRAQYTFADIVGNSLRMQEALRTALRAAEGGSTVLILGESGTGKELLAHAIHQASRRASGPFVVLNAAAVPEHLLESELFGHEKGAFTGALRTKVGRFELAHGGTLFLDEIGDMSPNLQAKLLRILQQQRFERVGGVETIAVDVRIITATNRDLWQRIQQGQFREDLYYRLNVMRVEIPPLRERREDLPDLVRALMQKLNRKLGTAVTAVEAATWDLLRSHSWPGNVRELENLLERAMNLADGPVLAAAPIARHVLETGRPVPEAGPTPAPRSEVLPLAEMERRSISEALQKFGHTVEGKKKVAQTLGISLSTLYARLRYYGLNVH